MANYRLSPDAEDDFARIIEFGILHFGLRQAHLYRRELIARFHQIAETPFSFQAVEPPYHHIRRCVHKSNSIYFHVGEREVLIIAIIRQQDHRKVIRRSILG